MSEGFILALFLIFRMTMDWKPSQSIGPRSPEWNAEQSSFSRRSLAVSVLL